MKEVVYLYAVKLKKSFPFVIIYNKLNKMYKRTDLLKAFLCTSKCKILVHFCFFIIYINL